MGRPADFNLIIYQGDSFVRDFQIMVNAAGEYVPISLINRTLLAQIRKKPEDTDILATFTTSVVDVDNGLIRASLTSEQTRILPIISHYDIQTVQSDGTVRTWLRGRIECPREVSRNYGV